MVLNKRPITDERRAARRRLRRLGVKQCIAAQVYSSQVAGVNESSSANIDSNKWDDWGTSEIMDAICCHVTGNVGLKRLLGAWTKSSGRGARVGWSVFRQARQHQENSAGGSRPGAYPRRCGHDQSQRQAGLFGNRWLS